MNNLQQLIKQQATIIADLQNQQAAAAQNSTIIPAPIPAPALAPRPSKVYITKPSDFNSNDYNTFK